MPTISESPIEFNQWKYLRIRAAFISGAIGEATFRVSLEILGVRGQDLTAEIAHAKREADRNIGRFGRPSA